LRTGTLLVERNNTRHNFGSSTSRKAKSTIGGQYHRMDWFEGGSLGAVKGRQIKMAEDRP